MSIRVRTWLVVVSALAAFAPGAPAQSQSVLGLFTGPRGARLVSFTNIQARSSGQFTVSFHGDAASGCAAVGVCGYSGTIVVRPRDVSLGITTVRRRGHLQRLATLDYDGGSAPYLTVANVQRSVPGGSGGVCADAAGSQDDGASATTPLRHGSLTIRLLGPDTAVLTTRCAGPLDGDLAAAGPQATIPVGRVLRGRIRLDLSGTRAFAVHGFAGTVSSTVVMHLGKPHRNSPGSSGNGFPPGTRLHRVRIVSQPLTLVRAAGRVTASVDGTPDPIVCRLLDSCGLTGTISLSPRVGAATADLTATGPASRPYRDFLAAVGLSRAGRVSGIRASAYVLWAGLGKIRAIVGQEGSCVDSARFGGGLVALTESGRRWTGSGNFAPWRTRCPGPIVGGQNPVFRASIGTRGLGGRTVTIRLRPVGHLEDDGYSITLHGHVDLTFTRGRLTQQVISEPVS